jgi:hypothetical protein
MARSRHPSLGVRRVGALAAVLLGFTGACDGDLVNLGSSALTAAGEAGASSRGGSGPHRGGVPEWRPESDPVLSEDGYSLANPTLGPEALFFTRQGTGEPDAHAYAATQDAGGFRLPDFDTDAPLALGEDTDGGVASPAVSLDGNELWFGKSEPGSLTATDVWVVKREGDGWTTPARVAELSSAADDAPRPPGAGGTLMPLSSKQADGRYFQIYLAKRAADGTWGTPDQALVGSLNAPGQTSVDGFLSEDGLTLYFASTQGAQNDSDLFRARRATLDDTFGSPEPLPDLPRDADERDPWLSPDGSWLYYSSNRTGLYAIYRARRLEAP